MPPLPPLQTAVAAVAPAHRPKPGTRYPIAAAAAWVGGSSQQKLCGSNAHSQPITNPVVSVRSTRSVCVCVRVSERDRERERH